MIKADKNFTPIHRTLQQSVTEINKIVSKAEMEIYTTLGIKIKLRAVIDPLPAELIQPVKIEAPVLKPSKPKYVRFNKMLEEPVVKTFVRPKAEYSNCSPYGIADEIF